MSIPVCHTGDRGSIPRQGDIFLLCNHVVEFTTQHISTKFLYFYEMLTTKKIYFLNSGLPCDRQEYTLPNMF